MISLEMLDIDGEVEEVAQSIPSMRWYECQLNGEELYVWATPDVFHALVEAIGAVQVED